MPGFGLPHSSPSKKRNRSSAPGGRVRAAVAPGQQRVTSELERTPVIPAEDFADRLAVSTLELKIRGSDEDGLNVCDMVTDQPLRLSLSYIATIAPVPSA